MKRTIPTLAVLMAATLFTAAAAHAQSANSDKAYPPGPTGQAAAQTTSVNVVNTPTVNVGNVVTVKGPMRTPLYLRAVANIDAGYNASNDAIVSAPAGTMMVIETINVTCGSTVAQPVGFRVYKTGISDPVATLIPVSMNSGGILVAGQPFPVHLEVDDALTVHSFRTNATGYSECSAVFSGYTTPLP